jgi:hypothetical protein
MDTVVCNMTGKAKVLQQWLAAKLPEDHIPRTAAAAMAL